MKKYFATLLLGTLAMSFLANFNLAQAAVEPKTPQSLEEAQKTGEQVLVGLPRSISDVWQWFLGLWKNIWLKIKGFWQKYIQSHLINLWNWIRGGLKKEVETRKPGIQEELEKEKGELKTDLPKTGKNIWERFMGLVKWWEK